MKLGTPPSSSVRLVDQMRKRIRYLHYSPEIDTGYQFETRALRRRSATGAQTHLTGTPHYCYQFDCYLPILNERKFHF